jgi:methylated-DNA-[protein]-cysteine S-methyltransferase
MSAGALRYRLIDTVSGTAALLAGSRGLRRVYLPQKSAEAARRAVLRQHPGAVEDARLLPRLARDLADYFAGRVVNFDAPLDFTDARLFDASVWRACASVEYGNVSTYKNLARALGKPAAARAVGGAMGRNPWPVVVPCHRILRSDGSAGGYSGPGGVQFKKRLLAMEAAATR